MDTVLPVLEVVIGHPDPAVAEHLRRAFGPDAEVTCIHDRSGLFRRMVDRQGLLTLACVDQIWLEESDGEFITALESRLKHALALACILAPGRAGMARSLVARMEGNLWLVPVDPPGPEGFPGGEAGVLAIRSAVEARRKALNESLCALQGAESLTWGGHLQVPRLNASPNRAADWFECRLVHWAEETFGCPVLSCASSFAHYWSVETRDSALEFILVAQRKNSTVDVAPEAWLLRVEEREPFRLADSISRQFQPRNRVLRPGLHGRTRVQFKASDLLPEGELARYGTPGTLGLPAGGVGLALDDLRQSAPLPPDVLPHADLPLNRIGSAVLASLLLGGCQPLLPLALAEAIRRLSDLAHPPPLAVAAEWLSRMGRLPASSWPQNPAYPRCLRALQSYWRMRAEAAASGKDDVPALPADELAPPGPPPLPAPPVENTPEPVTERTWNDPVFEGRHCLAAVAKRLLWDRLFSSCSTPGERAEACRQAEQFLRVREDPSTVILLGKRLLVQVLDLEVTHDSGADRNALCQRLARMRHLELPAGAPATAQPDGPVVFERVRNRIWPAGPIRGDNPDWCWKSVAILLQACQTPGEESTPVPVAPPTGIQFASADEHLRTAFAVIRLEKYIRYRILPTPQSALPPYNFFTQGPFDFHLDTLVERCRKFPLAVQALALRENFGVPDQYDRAADVRKLLVRVLDQIDPEGRCLASLALDPKAPPYVREIAVQHLGRRGDATPLPRLLPVVMDGEVPAEVRLAALQALARHAVPGSLPAIHWLLQEHARMEKAGQRMWIAPDALLVAGAGLGDITLLRELLEAAADSHWHTREQGKQGVNLLLERRGGLDGLLDGLRAIPDLPSLPERLHWALGREGGAVRLWLLDRLWECDNQELAVSAALECLGDSHALVVETACAHLCAMAKPPLERLFALARSAHEVPSVRLWAIHALLRSGQPVDDLLAKMPDSAVPVLPPLPAIVRQALVRHWGSRCRSGTDVRWRIEALRTTPASAADRVEREEELFRQLGTVGLHVPPLDEYDRKEYANCSFVKVLINEVPFRLCTFGPFLSPKEGPVPARLRDRVKTACARAGWWWYGEEELARVIPGLLVYFFGHIKPLPLEDLLFYWQD